MKYGTVIYTRTADYDYSDDFAIRPIDMPNSDRYHALCTEVFENVSRTRPRIRFMIGDRKGCLCGIATISSEALEGEYRFVDENREYRFLCGIFSEKPLSLPSAVHLIDIYQKEIANIWDKDTHSGPVEPVFNDHSITHHQTDEEAVWFNKNAKRMTSWLRGRKFRCYTMDLPEFSNLEVDTNEDTDSSESDS
ncbi:MAG: hypothetical protein RBR71_11485 [Gudongella sp.]|nr:hypothetical protein [Gudongella sp.]